MKKAKYKALDVARMVIWLTDTERGDHITGLKLHKLLFFLQGYWLANFERPLFDAPLEMWGYGPVAPAVHEAFKDFSRAPINVETEGQELPFSTAEEEAFFYKVFDAFNMYTASRLMYMVHQAVPFWAIAGGVGQGHVIPQDALRVYFKARRLTD